MENESLQTLWALTVSAAWILNLTYTVFSSVSHQRVEVVLSMKNWDFQIYTISVSCVVVNREASNGASDDVVRGSAAASKCTIRT